jgi:small subunit ribosomal protein S9
MVEASKKAVYWGTGRRKAAIARVRLVPGSGKLVVNGRTGEDYFNFQSGYISAARSPLETLGLEAEYDILVNAHGGGLTGQSDAVKLGVARALCELDPNTSLVTHVVWNVRSTVCTKPAKLLNTRNVKLV